MKGTDRTLNSNRAHYKAYMRMTGGRGMDAEKLKKCYGCKHPPINIMDRDKFGNVPILKLFCMSALHYLLGMLIGGCLHP